MLSSLVRGTLKLAGSLLLTVSILFLLIAILLWGTVLEKYCGTTAAKFGIYGSWWFNTLGFILAVNSAAGLVLRLPWKRQQLGFILPHLGLIVLLVGCYLSRCYGIEAALSVFEGESSNLAYKGPNQHVELDGQQHFSLTVIPEGGSDKAVEPIVVPFTSGPFNWEDYHDGTLNWTPAGLAPLHLPSWVANIPWSLAHRDQGLLYDRDGIRLEVLDYLSNSEIVLPSLSIQATPLGRDGHELSQKGQASRLAVKEDSRKRGADLHPYGVGEERALSTGQRILFWMTGSPEETDAFRKSKPSGPLGALGRVIIHARGKSYEFPVSGWAKGTSLPLGDSGLEVKLVGAMIEQLPVGDKVVLDPRLQLTICHDSESHPFVLSAEFPEIFSQQDYTDQVFGTFWPGQPEKSPSSPSPETTDAKVSAKKQEANSAAKPDPETKPVEPSAISPPRIDFFQGADQELYCRTWRAGQVRIVGPLKTGEEGGSITAFRDTPDAVALRFGDFRPDDRSLASATAVPFDKAEEQPHLRQAYVRLTVDDQSQEFWLPCSSPDPVEQKIWNIPKLLEQRTVVGKGRRVELGFAPESFRIGYTVHVNHAWRKLDPGTRQASFYGSEIDLVPNSLAKSTSAASPNKPNAGKNFPEYHDLLVTLNAPLDIADLALPGRSYRMFQASMNGPYDPEQFDRKPGESVYLSGFTLNYDPGRGLTYVGCLLIVAGIFVAYFVRFGVPRRTSARAPETTHLSR
jgi:hypothetical protein